MKDFPIAFELDIVKAQTKDLIRKGDRVIYGYASTFDVDSDDAQITKEALMGAKDDLLKYNTVLFNHNMDRPIGKVVETAVDGKGLLVTLVLSKEEDELWKKIEDGTMSKFSIRGRALETRYTEPNDKGLSILQIIKIKLFEVSLVSVPANVEATTLSSYVAKAFKDNEMEQTKSLIGELQILAGKLGDDDKKLIEELITLFSSLNTTNMDEKEKEYNLTDKSENRPIFQLNLRDGDVIELGESQTFRKQLLKYGRWYHWAADGGVLDVTKDLVKSIVKNFKKKTIDHVAIPLTHTSDPSKNTGEVIDLIQTDDGLDVICEIKDESIVEKIKNGLIKSISASIDPNYLVKASNKFTGPVLVHAALVQEPYIKGMSNFIPLSDEFDERPILSLESTSIFNEIQEIKGKLELLLKQKSEETAEEVEETVEEIDEEVPTEEVTEEVTEENAPTDEEIEKEIKKDAEETTEEVADETVIEEVEETEEEEEEDEFEKSAYSKCMSAEMKAGKSMTEAAKICKDKIKKSTEDVSEDKSETKSDDKTTKQDVDLAEVEKEFDGYLKAGKVVPAQKEAFIRLLSSKKEVELSDGSEVDLSTVLKSFFDAQPKIINFDEEGITEDPTVIDPTQTKATDGMPPEVKDFYTEKLGLSDEDSVEAWKHAQELKREEDENKSTLFN